MRRTVFTVAIVVLIAAGAFAYHERHRHVPVLVYHAIAAGEVATSAPTVERDLLARELDYLRAHGFTTLTLSQAASLTRSFSLPAKPVVLTFDDADRGQLLYALPLLKERDMVATFFPASGWLGRPGKLTNDDIRTLHDAGMEIGGHTRSHLHLFALTDQQLADEITAEKAALEKILRTALTAFAYPFGEHDARIDHIVRDSGYTITRGATPENFQRKDVDYFDASVMTNSFDAFLRALTPPTADIFSF